MCTPLFRWGNHMTLTDQLDKILNNCFRLGKRLSRMNHFHHIAGKRTVLRLLLALPREKSAQSFSSLLPSSESTSFEFRFFLITQLQRGADFIHERQRMGMANLFPARQRQVSASNTIAASAMMRHDILEQPHFRSRKVMGTSTTFNPSQTAIAVPTNWKA